MCVIIDANQLGDFAAPNTNQSSKDGMKRLHKWIRTTGGRVVYPQFGKYAAEIASNSNAVEVLTRYKRARRVKAPRRQELDDAMKEFAKKDMKSNDAHILAAAKASRATLLCTKDRDLMDDFRDLIEDGKIYPNGKRAQRDVLRDHKCKNI